MLKIFHIDGNFALWRQDTIKKLLTDVAHMGYNTILWELENQVQLDTLKSANLPEAMSKSEFKKLLNFASSLKLEAIPALQTMGHAEYVLLNPDFFKFRENPARHDCYCTSEPDVRKFLKSLIDEYLSIFGEVRFFHLGGDEVYEFGSCPACKQRIAKVGHNKFYYEHLEEISDTLFQKNIRPGIWGDMMLSHYEDIINVSKKFVIWDWNYWHGSEKLINSDEIIEKFPELKNKSGKVNGFYTVDLLQNNGFEVIRCCASRSAGDHVFLPSYKIHADNILGTVKLAKNRDLLGICMTSWSLRLINYQMQMPLVNLLCNALNSRQARSKTIQMRQYETYFGVAGAKHFYRFTDKRLEYHPFNITNRIGLQWNNLKDQLPAPADLIEQNIKQYKKDPARWADRYEQLAKAKNQMQLFKSNLVKTLNVAEHNKKLLSAYLEATQYSIIYLDVIEAVLKKSDNSAFDIAKVEAQLKQLKTYSYNLFLREQAEISAKTKINILWNPLITYFNLDTLKSI